MNHPISPIRCCPRRPGRQAGVAMLLVLVALLVAVVLGLTFLAAQATATGIAANTRRHAQARYIAESALTAALRQVTTDANWRQTMGTFNGSTSTSFAGGTFTLKLEDGTYLNGQLTGDGSLTDDPSDEATLTAVGRFEGVSHVVRARLTPVQTQQPGIKAEYWGSDYELNKLDDVAWEDVPDYVTTVPNINFALQPSWAVAWSGGPTEYWAARYTARINIPTAGTWTFYTNSDDGSRLWIDGQLVVDNDGTHSMATRSGAITLTAGAHDFLVKYYEWRYDQGCIAYWRGPGVSTQTVIPATAFTLPPVPTVSQPSLIVSDYLYLWGNNSANSCFIDGFDSTQGPYSDTNRLLKSAIVSTNSTAAQKVTLSGRASINGNVRVGPAGDPSKVIVTWDKSTITGTRAALDKAQTIPSVAEPTGMPANEGNKQYLSSTTFTANRQFQDFQAWGNNTVLTINGKITWLVNGDFQIGDKVQINLTAGSSLRLFVRGNASLYSFAQINTNTGNPKLFELNMLGSGKNIVLTDHAKLCGRALNPTGGLQMYGNSKPGSELFGSYTGRSFEITDKAAFHADVAPDTTSTTTPPTTMSTLLTWQEQP